MVIGSRSPFRWGGYGGYGYGDRQHRRAGRSLTTLNRECVRVAIAAAAAAAAAVSSHPHFRQLLDEVREPHRADADYVDGYIVCVGYRILHIRRTLASVLMG